MKAPVLSPVRPSGPVYEPPQYAEFETGRKGGEDALPVMPTWETAGSKKVLVEEEHVEMDQLNKSSNGQTVASASAAAAASAAAVAAAAGHTSPGISTGSHSPYRQPSPVGPNGHPAQYANQPQAHGYDTGYGQATSPYGSEQYGTSAMAAAPRMRSPHQDHNSAYDQYGNHYDSRQSPQAYRGDYSQSPQAAQSYGVEPRRLSPASPAYGQEPVRRSPAPPSDYGYNQQQFGASAGYRQPQVQQTGPLQNTGGFDFNSGYSRPQEYSDRDRRPSPAAQQPNNGGYTAYTPYSTQQQRGWN